MAYRTGRTRQPVDLGGLTELRVHGVGGASPEQTLDVPYTDWVSGDLTAGFFAAPGPPIGSPPRRLEAYSWGGLTSRSRLRALWLLLLPFALVNLAGWMAERRTGDGIDSGRVRLWVRVGVASTRLLAVTTSAAAILYVSVGAIDLFAYQCGGNACAQPGRWLSWPLATAWVEEALGRRLLVGAAVPLAVAGLVAFITKRSQDFVHADQPLPRQGRPLDPALDTDLGRPEFWQSPHVAHRLGVTHTAAAVAVIGFVLASTAAAVPGLGVGGWWRSLFAGALVAAGVEVMAVRVLPTSANWALLATVTVALAALAIVLLGADAPTAPGPAPGARDLALPLFWIGVIALVVLSWSRLSLRPRRRRDQPEETPRRSLWSRLADRFAATAVAVLGWGTVIAVGSGLLIQYARLLGSATPQAAWDPATAPDDTIVYFDTSGTVAVLTVLTMAAVALAALGFTAWRWARRERSVRIADAYRAAGIVADPRDPRTRQVLRSVGLAQAVASVTDYAGAILGIGIVVLVAGAAWSLGSEIPVAWQTAASGVLAVLPLVAVYLINRSRESPGVRRGVGILWDVATFWPRWFHPFAPPSYGERAVPQLTHRIGTILDDGGRVVLSAHSQGSVVGAGALALLAGSRGDLAGVTFLTHGSPLGRLYGRFFGRHVDQELLGGLAGELSRSDGAGWVNLWRRTDFIGGSVFDPADPRCDEVELLDPPRPVPMVGESSPRPQRHFNYTDDPAYDERLGLLGTEAN